MLDHTFEWRYQSKIVWWFRCRIFGCSHRLLWSRRFISRCRRKRFLRKGLQKFCWCEGLGHFWVLVRFFLLSHHHPGLCSLLEDCPPVVGNLDFTRLLKKLEFNFFEIKFIEIYLSWSWWVRNPEDTQKEEALWIHIQWSFSILDSTKNFCKIKLGFNFAL